MNDINHCPNHDLLVTFLYEECEPAERETMAAHLALCASCAEDVQGLRDARVHLAAWSPPALPLGFQLTRTESEQPSKVLRPVAWWSKPLPAWAQAAAAAVIFAAGMTAGAMRPDSSELNELATRAVTPAPATVSTVSRGELERLDARLRAIENGRSQLVSIPRTPAGNIDEPALMLNVGTLIDERVTLSERRNTAALNEMAGALQAYRDESTERMDLLEADQRSQDTAITSVARRGWSSALVQPTSYQPAGR